MLHSNPEDREHYCENCRMLTYVFRDFKTLLMGGREAKSRRVRSQVADKRKKNDDLLWDRKNRDSEDYHNQSKLDLLCKEYLSLRCLDYTLVVTKTPKEHKHNRKQNCKE